jgi:hypothetical protein
MLNSSYYSKLTVLFLKELFPFSSNLHTQLLLLQQINSAIFKGVISLLFKFARSTPPVIRGVERANLKRREITPSKIALLICCNKRS